MKIKTLLGIASILAMLATPVFAETGRLGEDRISFNPSRIVTKTSAYTATASDSQIDVNATSAAVVITLPSISSLTAGATKAYKIVKTDSSTYTVTVTPATGDTIGGESTRVIINDDAYMVISTGPNNNWTIDFESPYVAEDHEAGTVDINTYSFDSSIIAEGATEDAYETTFSFTDPTADRTVTVPNAAGTVALRTGETTTATDTLTAGECGKVIFLNSATEFATALPAVSTVASGCTFDFVVKAAAASADYTVTTGNSLENKIYGTMEVAGAVVACSAEDTITLVDGNAVGDRFRVVSDGAAWYVSGFALTTAKMTCTTAD